jgi:hypothetical protein
MSDVTSEDFAARLIRSAEQAAAIKAGRMEPARRSLRKVTRAAGTGEDKAIQDEASKPPRGE